MYKNTIESMNALQEERLRAISRRDGRLHADGGPPTGQSGLYWIYTRHTDEELLDSIPSPRRASINFKMMAQRHADLDKLCSRKVGDFRVVYSGIGGVGPRGSGGLRERILEEFRGGEGTGSLAIVGSSRNELENWRYSYVLWSEIAVPENPSYAEFGEHLERLWRLHYGWPLLCAR